MGEAMVIERFKAFDLNGDGFITTDELFDTLRHIGFDQAQAKQIMVAADVDHDGRLSYEEFADWVFGSATGASLTLSKADSAPFLKKYFEKVKEHAVLEQEVTKITLHDGPDAAEEKHQQAAKLLKAAKPLLRQSFDRHDKAGSGVLEPTEAMVFFSNVVSLQGALAEMATALMVTESVRMFAKHMGGSKTEIAAKIEQKQREIEETVALQLLEYKSDKAARDKAAFRVVDQAGCGTINFKEFEAALNPDDPVSGKFLAALGLCPIDP